MSPPPSPFGGPTRPGKAGRVAPSRHRHIEFMAVAIRIVPTIREPIWAVRSRVESSGCRSPPLLAYGYCRIVVDERGGSGSGDTIPNSGVVAEPSDGT